MPLPIYLAMTAAEFHGISPLPSHLAWMACHFSPYGTGLSNCPAHLPPGAMLILNDRTPVCGHNPEVIAKQLAELVAELGCSRVLLDLQRPDEGLIAKIVGAILEALPCPVGVSERYATELGCPVFLPPVPLLQPLSAYLAPWQGREIWLEMAPENACYAITEAGCRRIQAANTEDYRHEDAALCCRYRMEETKDAVLFHVRRDTEKLMTKLQERENVTCLVGLYQELG